MHFCWSVIHGGHLRFHIISKVPQVNIHMHVMYLLEDSVSVTSYTVLNMILNRDPFLIYDGSSNMHLAW